jgi:hypothetical protein
VGIGTASPSKKLHVYRNDTGQDAQIQIEQAGSGSPTLGFLETGVYSWLIGQYGADNSFRIAASGADLNTSPRLTIDTSGNLQFNSGYGSAATAYGCRAWVNFNGLSGASPVVRNSGNISSVTRTATGQYTIAFTSALTDINYVVTGNASTDASGRAVKVCVFTTNTTVTAPTTSSFLVNLTSDSNVAYDAQYVTLAVFR